MQVKFSEIPFSWSLRRRRFWNECRRRYFLYYYAARGGHEALSDPQTRLIHERKQLQERDSYLNGLLNQAMRELFYSPREAQTPDRRWEAAPLEAVALRRLRREFSAMISGRPFHDHRLPMLREIADRTMAPSRLLHELEDAIRPRVRDLECGAWQFLGTIPISHRRPIETPLPVMLNRLTCYTTPVLAAWDHDQLLILDAGSNSSPPTALLDKFHALNQWNCAPERVVSAYIDPRDGTLQNNGNDLNISAEIAGIDADCTAMRAMVRDDGTMFSEDFPRALHCPGHCPFFRVCQQNPEKNARSTIVGNPMN